MGTTVELEESEVEPEEKKHFSTVSQTWEKCNAKQRKCRYDAGEHKTDKQIKEIKERQKEALARLSAEDVKEVHGETIVKHVGATTLDRAYTKYTKAKSVFTEVAEKILKEEKHTSNKFDEQFNNVSSKSATVLGQLDITSIPDTKDIRIAAKAADNTLKEELGRASMLVFEAENELKDVAVDGIELT